MNFNKFPVDSTTIFPAANSRAGGQLLTEYNQLSRESIANHAIIPYVCGPSYTHSLDDFKISSDYNGHILYISGGLALVHGHFVHLDNKSAKAISIDMSETDLSGNLTVGLRAMYSNDNTIAATLKTEDGNDFYEGIQVVILPSNRFLLPEDNNQGTFTSPGLVTAHLKLGTFVFNNNQITDVVPNPDRFKVLDAERVFGIDDLLSDQFVTKTGLDPWKLYTFATKYDQSSSSSNPTYRDTWSDSTGSIMIWDADPGSHIRSIEDYRKPIWLKDGNVPGNDQLNLVTEAVARYDNDDDKVKLIIPHKQVNGMRNTSNKLAYYEPRELPFPVANRATLAGGVLDSHWVNFLNGLDDKIATMYRMPGGKMRKFISVLADKNDLPKPPIGYYSEQQRNAAYYDNRLQYSFNLLQTQVAQLNNKFIEFQQNLESTWKDAVASDVTSELSEQNNLTNSNLEALRQTVANFQGDVSSISSSIADAGSQLTGHIEAYEALVAQVDNQNESLGNRITVLENRWTSTTGTGSGSGSGSGSSTSQKDTEQDTEIADLKAQLASLKTQVEKIDSGVTTIKANVDSAIRNTSSNLDTLYQSLYGANKDGSSGDIKDASTAIEQLRSQYDYLYDVIHDLYSGVESIVQQSQDSIYNKLLGQLKSTIDSEIALIAEQYNVSAQWSPGDYVLVAQDQTLGAITSDETSFPSTMYVVVPGMTPLDSKYVASYYDVYQTDLSTPINSVSSTSDTSVKTTYSDAIDSYNSAVATLKRQVPARFVYGYELGSNDVEELSSSDELPDVYNSTEMLNALYNSSALIEGVRGTPGKDYFVMRYRYPVENSTSDVYVDSITGETYEGIQCQIYRWVSVFFTLDFVTDKIELDVDNPIILSGGTPYAEEGRVGGFLNVGSDVYGAGYVSRDEYGHLKLNDFEFLAAGVSAYQLGEDRTEGAGLDITELQNVFDQYVNNRIAFPNDEQLYRASEKHLRTDVITIDLNIGSTSEGVLNIYNIDTRFDTAVHLNITGSATENVVINITNCQRLRLSMDPTSSPAVFLENVCLYYDADILDRVASIEGLTLWYEQWDEMDPNLQVDGMTVIYQDKLEPKGTYNFWTKTSLNDNSYAYALRQITFASDGTIIGIGVAITDNTTANIQPVSESIFASTFALPQTIGLPYPITKLTKQIKVTGNFVTAYYSTQGSKQGYSVKNTTFTMLTQKYLKYTDVKEYIQGVISFYTKTTFVQDAAGVDSGTLMALGDEFAIDGWEAGAYHIFYGGAVE